MSIRRYAAALFLATALFGQVSSGPSEVAPAKKSATGTPSSAPAADTVVSSHKAEFAGNGECKSCHPAEWNAFYKNSHFKSIASGKEPPERTGCEGCHGPAKAHIAAGGGKTTIPHAFTTMKPAEIIQTCLTCHAQDFNRANIHRSEHTQHDVACTQCHSNHHPETAKNLLAKSQPELCYQCHGDGGRSSICLPSTV